MPDPVPFAGPATRRSFLRHGATAAVALPAVVSSLAACTDTKLAARTTENATPAAPPPAPPSPRQKADEMDAMHEKGIKAFPAKTEGKGNQLLQPRIENGVKVYELTAEEIQWEVEPGRKVKAWAYNGQVPGPQIRVREGDRVRVDAEERARRSPPSIHFHGLELPNDQDGVPFITQPPVKPGESLHLRVHGAERRLAHVPLAPQRGHAGRAWASSARSSWSRSGRVARSSAPTWTTSWS